MAKTTIEIRPIGFIKTCFQQKFAIPRQSLLVEGCLGEIFFEAGYSPEFLLDGLEGFSHIWLIWYFDKAEAISKSKITPPKVKEKKGIFATRSPHRPNSIGLSCLKLVEVRERSILVDGVDILNDSPILDIKPYIAKYDALKSIEPPWCNYKSDIFEVIWNKEATEGLEKNQKIYFNKNLNLKSVIEDLIKLDPRPIPYINKTYKDVYSFYIYDLNVSFSVLDKQAMVLGVGLNPLCK